MSRGYLCYDMSNMKFTTQFKCLAKDASGIPILIRIYTKPTVPLFHLLVSLFLALDIFSLLFGGRHKPLQLQRVVATFPSMGVLRNKKKSIITPPLSALPLPAQASISVSACSLRVWPIPVEHTSRLGKGARREG